MRPVLIDDGDGDGRADTGETIEMPLVIRNASGVDLTGVHATLAAAEDEIDVGLLLAGETRVTSTGFALAVERAGGCFATCGP